MNTIHVKIVVGPRSINAYDEKGHRYVLSDKLMGGEKTLLEEVQGKPENFHGKVFLGTVIPQVGREGSDFRGIVCGLGLVPPAQQEEWLQKIEAAKKPSARKEMDYTQTILQIVHNMDEQGGSEVLLLGEGGQQVMRYTSGSSITLEMFLSGLLSSESHLSLSKFAGSKVTREQVIAVGTAHRAASNLSAFVPIVFQARVDSPKQIIPAKPFITQGPAAPTKTATGPAIPTPAIAQQGPIGPALAPVKVEIPSTIKIEGVEFSLSRLNVQEKKELLALVGLKNLSKTQRSRMNKLKGKCDKIATTTA